ncbi:hypothetical protein ES703_45047 [subsurface metagenome]
MKITISLRSTSIHALISSFFGRAIPRMVACLQFSFTIALTIFFSVFETAGNPTAINLTPISSINFVKWIFSSKVR